MLNGVKKSVRLKLTVNALIDHADELQYFLDEILTNALKDYSEEELKQCWELEEDIN